MKKAFKIIKYIVNTLVTVFVILFLLMVCLQRFSNNEVSFFNYRLFTVASGSMAPQYNVGDVLIAKETAPEDIKVGDSLTYLGNSGTFTGKVVTHEVTRIEKTTSGEYIFHTKGKANLIEDPPVYQKQVYGVIVWNPKILSFIYKIVGTQYGLFIFVVLPIFYIIGSEMLTAMIENEEKRRKEYEERKAAREKKEQEELENKEKEEKVEETKEEIKEEKVEEPKVEKKKTTTKKTTTKKTTEKKDTPKKETTKKETTKKTTTKKTTTKKDTKTK